MGEIAVNFPAMEAAHADLMDAYQKYQSVHEHLKGDLQPLASTWTGGSRDKYIEQQGKWDEAYAAVTAVVNEISAKVDNARARYGSAEAENLRAMGG
jgi:WXG100 family type VII secretion target